MRSALTRARRRALMAGVSLLGRLMPWLFEAPRLRALAP